MADLIFVAQFTCAKVGKTGLTVTVDVDRYTISDGTRTALVTAGAATEGRRGLYHYRLASADLSLYQYVTTFITTNTTVDQQEIPSLGLVVPDALVGSRLATAGYTAPPSSSDNATAAAAAILVTPANKLATGASGVASANVTAVKGAALTETAAGRLAAALSKLLDVETPVLTAASVNQGGDAYARLGAPAGASVSADVAAVKADAVSVKAKTDNLPASPAATGDIPTAAQNADAVLDEALSGHLTPGTAGAALSAAGSAGDPWSTDLPGSYAGDEAGWILGRLADLDLTAVQLDPNNNAGHLTITTALTFETQISGLTVPSDWASATWTLKRVRRDADTAALVQLRVSNPAAGTDGLLVLNGAAATDKALGSLSINAGAGTAGLMLSDDLTAQLAARPGLVWAVKFLTAAGKSKEYEGTADVELSVTHGI